MPFLLVTLPSLHCWNKINLMLQCIFRVPLLRWSIAQNYSTICCYKHRIKYEHFVVLFPGFLAAVERPEQ